MINGKRPRFQKLDHGLEIRRLSISGADNIQLFLNLQLRFVTDRLLCVPDVHYTSGECDLFDGCSERSRGANRFDGNIRSPAFGHFQQSVV